MNNELTPRDKELLTHALLLLAAEKAKTDEFIEVIDLIIKMDIMKDFAKMLFDAFRNIESKPKDDDPEGLKLDRYK